MELKIYIRHTQYFAILDSPSQGLVQGNPIVYAGTTPANLHPVNGTVPQSSYMDISGDVGNLDRIQLTWTSDRSVDGVSVPGAFQPKKSASNNISIEGDAYNFIKAWLINHVAAPLNTIDVKIEDTSCGVYEEYVIRSKQITWCEDGICQFDLVVQQKDESLQCIQQTLVSDNWQGWFQTVPAGGKKHPRFAYCNEVKPNGMMVMLWWLSSVIFTIVILMYIGIMPIIWAVQLIMGVILTIVDAIGWLLGFDVDFDDNFNFTNPSDFLNSLGSFYVESSGCGRLHPAPLIRDYIDNVCKKCKIRVDAVTDPIFHGQTITLKASSGMKNNVPNPHYNATYFNAPAKRGIRIFRGLFSNYENTTDYYIPENRPVLALDQFLDQVKTLYNAEWRLTNNTLYFWRKDWYLQGSVLYDFSDNAPDRLKILQGICFNWLDKKQYAYMRGVYTDDAADTCGNEAVQYMNDIVSLGDATNNPVYEGYLDKRSQYFGATRFRLDGASDDYICNAMQVVLNGAALNPTIPAIMSNFVVPAVKNYADYALLLSDEVCTLAKVIIWDPGSGFEYARAIRNKNTYPSSNGSGLPMPTPNTYYNPSSEQWNVKHMPQTYVTGSGLSFGSSPPGKYTVQEYFGIDFYAQPALLCNYPMFFAAGYQDNIYDWFHWIDDTRINPKLNMQFDLKIDLCCDDLKKLRVLNDASNIALMEKVRLPLQYYNEGTITEITVSYDSEDDYGKWIQIKGVV